MVIRLLLILSCFGLTFQGNAQDSAFIHAGLWRTQGTFSVGSMSGPGLSPIYLHGDLEYYAEQHISVRSDIYFYLNNFEKSDTLNVYHSNFTGIVWHPAKKGMLDPYLGFQPGAGLVKHFDPIAQKERTQITPLASITAGVNYYAPKWFHLFLNTRYISGRLSNTPGGFSLNELRFSFGLGFNIK